MARSLPRLLLMALVGTLLAAVGCETKAGDPCEANTATCLDRDTKLSCLNGRYTQVPCRGPDGCRNTGGKNVCDVSIGRDGDVCATENEGKGACSADGKQMLTCKDGKMTLRYACRGKEGCKDDGGDVRCAEPALGEVGDPCDGEGAACTPALDAMLHCKEGRLSLGTKCACWTKDGQVGCR